ncbi:DNA-binding LytR/AlgR family response regulator [Hymenobacter luteus]|uniref:DNA-binding LytR/AlgR family response regulator n=2 Tax=Hymenobacter TaxID=89966 RepID=A0A7W9WBL0_9BACT|nr:MULTISPECIES: response regulator transcription factor [Hymenobacter]MBB4599933.1 DNA-binding LytR/AlgR family response regulator [Hymenobacter latericoloratus]MBB6057757.1 DNA-binding LytR/AlgR family response regulator [Hymenobacter luteus]
MTCAILDDEPLALDLLADYCAQVPGLELKGQFDDALAGLAFLQDNPVDVVFLDIHMPRLTGLQLAQLLPQPGPRIVFTTAYDQYAVRSYELNAADYLLKPIAFERFVQAVQKVRQQLSAAPAAPSVAQAAEAPPTAPDAMFVKNEHRLQRVAFDDILYIEGMKEYLMIYTTTGKVLTLQSFRRVEEVLPPERFARIHKSYLVALSRIEHVERGKVQVAGRLLPIGDTYRDSFNALIKAYNQL